MRIILCQEGGRPGPLPPLTMVAKGKRYTGESISMEKVRTEAPKGIDKAGSYPSGLLYFGYPSSLDAGSRAPLNAVGRRVVQLQNLPSLR